MIVKFNLIKLLSLIVSTYCPLVLQYYLIYPRLFVLHNDFVYSQLGQLLVSCGSVVGQLFVCRAAAETCVEFDGGVNISNTALPENATSAVREFWE